MNIPDSGFLKRPSRSVVQADQQRRDASTLIAPKPRPACHGAGRRSRGPAWWLRTLGVPALAMIVGGLIHAWIIAPGRVTPLPSAPDLAQVVVTGGETVRVTPSPVVVADLSPGALPAVTTVQRIAHHAKPRWTVHRHVQPTPRRHAPTARVAVAPAAQPAPVPVRSKPSKPSATNAFGAQVVVYTDPHGNAGHDKGSQANAQPAPSNPASGYRVVSIPSANLALIASTVDGKTLVNPYREGQALPDGTVVKQIDADDQRVVTTAGTLAVTAASGARMGSD